VSFEKGNDGGKAVKNVRPKVQLTEASGGTRTNKRRKRGHRRIFKDPRPTKTQKDPSKGRPAAVSLGETKLEKLSEKKVKSPGLLGGTKKCTRESAVRGTKLNGGCQGVFQKAFADVKKKETGKITPSLIIVGTPVVCSSGGDKREYTQRRLERVIHLKVKTKTSFRRENTSGSAHQENS